MAKHASLFQSPFRFVLIDIEEKYFERSENFLKKLLIEDD
jgi:hypothetical protein